MYGTETQLNTVGSFLQDKNLEFKQGFKRLHENFTQHEQLDPVTELARVLSVNAIKESYKEALIGDVLMEQFEDPYLKLLPEKMEQLFENTQDEIVAESFTGTMLPIVGYSLPILKKSFLECHAKDIVMTEIPKEPIVKIAFERKFMKDKAGTKYYIPEVFYNNDYKEVMKHAKGNPIPKTWYPESGTVPFQDFNVLEAAGGSLTFRDSLAYDFVIEAVKMTVDGEEVIIEGLSIRPEKSTNNGSFAYLVKGTNPNTQVTESDYLTGAVDFYHGLVSVASTGGKITQVRFGGHLSNQNNMNSLEMDRERESRTWEIPDGVRFNTGFTLEKIKDSKALLNLDVMAETIADMSTVMTQYEDSEILSFLDDSFNRWKDKTDLPFGYQNGFTESWEFSMTPNVQTIALTPQWAEQLKWHINRELDALKEKLKTADMMFVLYGNPAQINLLQDEIKWLINDNHRIGGVQLEYKFGVLNKVGSRVHVVSSMKVPRDAGLKIVGYPTTDEHITFKHYKYSLNIANDYRNPNTPLIPNVMGTTRFLTTEVLPIQGHMDILDDDFGRKTIVR